MDRHNVRPGDEATGQGAGQSWWRKLWVKVRDEVGRLLRNPRIAVLSTVFDYYGFPRDAPGMADRAVGDARSRIEHVESAIADVIGDPRFVPHLTLHETEAWVFAAASQLGDLFGSPSLGKVLRREAAVAGGPELVNDGPHSAPSKRLLGHRAEYDKLFHGPLALSDLGLDRLREQCPHLDAWLRRFEST
jgi:hypothetical protein